MSTLGHGKHLKVCVNNPAKCVIHSRRNFGAALLGVHGKQSGKVGWSITMHSIVSKFTQELRNREKNTADFRWHSTHSRQGRKGQLQAHCRTRPEKDEHMHVGEKKMGGTERREWFALST